MNAREMQRLATSYLEARHDGAREEFLRQRANESIDDFLTRLIPSKTTIFEGSWIYVSAKNHDGGTTNDVDVAQEKGWTNAISECQDILTTFECESNDIMNGITSRPEGDTKRKRQLHVAEKRRVVIERIQQIATKHNCCVGKWMLFYSAEMIDEAWERVARSTYEGKLGISAKVATSTPAVDNAMMPSSFTFGSSNKFSLICVYTRDFNDLDDLKRVLVELHRLGLTPIQARFDVTEDSGGGGSSSTSLDPSSTPTSTTTTSTSRRTTQQPLHSPSCSHKPDIYTYLGIDTGNPWKIPPVLFRYKDFMMPESKSSTKNNSHSVLSWAKSTSNVSKAAKRQSDVGLESSGTNTNVTKKRSIITVASPEISESGSKPKKVKQLFMDDDF